MLTFINDYFRKVQVYILKHKSGVFGKFKQWKNIIKRQIGKKIKSLRIGNDMEFCDKEFNKFCNNEGIMRHHTIRHTPQQNGVAKRINRTIFEKVRCMLSNAKLLNEFWVEVVNSAYYLANISPSILISFKTPKEVWFGSLSNYVNLRIFLLSSLYSCE